MRWPLHLCGTIHDLTLSVSWDRNSPIEQVDRRVGILCDLGVRPGNPVAIVHGSSAGFVADLLAVWSCGAIAVLLDATLAENELKSSGFHRSNDMKTTTATQWLRSCGHCIVRWIMRSRDNPNEV
jgi:acyl-CoA synthetase (AMP-forming)/AMP-acid ligase II